MKTKVERTINEAYLIIEDDIKEENDYTDGIEFEIHMLKENAIEGLLPVGCRKKEGINTFMYSVRGYTSLFDMYENKEIRSEMLSVIIQGLQDTLSRLEEYLIKTDHILLDPQYVFINSVSEKLSLCVFPYSKSSLSEELKLLSEYLISKTDHNENRAIDLAYGLYRQVMSGDYRFDELLRDDPVQTEVNIMSKEEEYFDNTRMKQNERNNSEVRSEGHGNIGKTVVSLLIFSIVIFCFALCVLMLYFR